MGREVKRIHIDFDLFEREDKHWKGYLLGEVDCISCDGTGKNLKEKTCPSCYGECKSTPTIEPPKGYDFEKSDGYQIWEDVSEGSPVSPVFMKPEDLAKWMVKNDTSITAGTSHKAWLNMIKEEGSAPSGVMDSEGFKSGMSLYEKKESEK